jgi:hypothetical protein
MVGRPLGDYLLLLMRGITQCTTMVGDRWADDMGHGRCFDVGNFTPPFVAASVAEGEPPEHSDKPHILGPFIIQTPQVLDSSPGIDHSISWVA